MVKFLLLELAFGLAHAQMYGPWKTIAIAADNVDKMEISGELRLYFHQITCEKECKKMNVTFYVDENGQCSLTTITGYLQDDGKTYRSQFQGDNHYATVRTTPENIVFYSENVDRAGRKTKLVYVVGKNGSGSLK
ncbi:odorant-binding protein 1a-like [Mus caroli]|uniref:Odorant-binding protein 1a-like n=1 Tax=Mus caroli TaxID=10089 RepID=A0A6P5P6F4_MUSCR|nr:odorant-binding protein 1a-like [Mus caroli]